MSSPRVLAHLLLLATVLVWGATFAVVKAALAEVSPLLFNVVRMSLAALALGVVNWRHLRRVPASHLKAGALTGLFLAAGYQFQTVGWRAPPPPNRPSLPGWWWCWYPY